MLSPFDPFSSWQPHGNAEQVASAWSLWEAQKAEVRVWGDMERRHHRHMA